MKHGNRCDIVDRSLKRSFIWFQIEKLYLTVNQRALSSDDEEEERRKFSKFLLDIGEANNNYEDEFILLPEEICSKSNTLNEL